MLPIHLMSFHPSWIVLSLLTTLLMTLEVVLRGSCPFIELHQTKSTPGTAQQVNIATVRLERMATIMGINAAQSVIAPGRSPLGGYKGSHIEIPRQTCLPELKSSAVLWQPAPSTHQNPALLTKILQHAITVMCWLVGTVQGGAVGSILCLCVSGVSGGSGSRLSVSEQDNLTMKDQHKQ